MCLNLSEKFNEQKIRAIFHTKMFSQHTPETETHRNLNLKIILFSRVYFQMPGYFFSQICFFEMI